MSHIKTPSRFLFVVLCTLSSVHACRPLVTEDAGVGPLNHSCFFIEKPYHASDLKEQLERLVRYNEHRVKGNETPEA